LKGPRVGADLLPISEMSAEGLATAASTDLVRNSATRVLVVDLLGFDTSVQRAIETAVRAAPNPRNKQLVFLFGE